MASHSSLCLVVDAGSAFFKGALYHCDGTYQCLATATVPKTLPAHSLLQLINNLFATAEITSKSAYQLVLIGEIPELANNALLQGSMRVQAEEAYAMVLKHLSSSSGVACIDIGAKYITLGSAYLGQVRLEHQDIGVGQEAWTYVRQNQRVQAVINWMPVEANNEEIENYLANKSIYPSLTPLTARESAIEQALAKTMLDESRPMQASRWQNVEHVILMGAILAGAESYAQSLAILLDGIQPSGLMQVSVDKSLTLLCAGGLLVAQQASDYHPGRALLDTHVLPVGSIVGLAQPAKKHVIRVELDAGLKSRQIMDIRSGEIVRVPWNVHDTGALYMLDAVGEMVRWSSHKSTEMRSTVGGEVGMVIDGRGRPLPLSEKANERRGQLLAWDRQMNAHQQVANIGDSQ
jgi:hypothetical protein